MAKGPIWENNIHHLMSRFELGLVSVLLLGFLKRATETDLFRNNFP